MFVDPPRLDSETKPPPLLVTRITRVQSPSPREYTYKLKPNVIALTSESSSTANSTTTETSLIGESSKNESSTSSNHVHIHTHLVVLYVALAVVFITLCIGSLLIFCLSKGRSSSRYSRRESDSAHVPGIVRIYSRRKHSVSCFM